MSLVRNILKARRKITTHSKVSTFLLVIVTPVKCKKKKKNPQIDVIFSIKMDVIIFVVGSRQDNFIFLFIFFNLKPNH